MATAARGNVYTRINRATRTAAVRTAMSRRPPLAAFREDVEDLADELHAREIRGGINMPCPGCGSRPLRREDAGLWVHTLEDLRG